VTVELHRMANGVRVVTERMPGLQSASLGVWVAAGGRHERVDQNGVAHFLEHMAFKGTTKRSALQIAEAIENVGGYINAYTSREMTAYYARVLADDVPLALDVISDIVLNPIFDSREIDVERHVILQEIGQSFDTPDDVIFDWLQETAFPDQPIGRTILGPAERVQGFHAADLKGFVHERYAPGNIILSAAGAVDHDAIVRAAEIAFGGLTERDGGVADPAQFRGGERRVEKDLEQAHFALAFETPGYRDDAVYTAQLFSTAFGGGMSSRLFQEAREKRGLCYSIFAQTGAYADSGLMTVYAGTGAEDVGELVHLIIDELKRAANEMSPAELARSRAQLKAGLLMGLESPASRAERLARLLSIWDMVPPIEDTVEKIDAVTTGDAREFAAGLVDRAQAALALYGPVSAAPDHAQLTGRLAA